MDEHQKRYKAIDGYSDNLRICGGIKCLRDTTIEKRNEKFADIANVKKIRIHDFRHSHTSLLAITVLTFKKSPDVWDIPISKSHGIYIRTCTLIKRKKPLRF